MTTQTSRQSLQQPSFESEFFEIRDNEPDQPRFAGTGRIAIAKGNARQIVGNIINQYYELPKNTEVQAKWLKVVEWLVPSEEAVNTQALVHRDARDSQAVGTGSWFLDSSAFQDWLCSSTKLTWLNGSGK